MAYDKRIRKHILKRRFTVTKAQAILGFIISTVFSVMLSTYFDQYGMELYAEIKSGITGNSSENVEEVQEKKVKKIARSKRVKKKAIEVNVETDPISDLRQLNSYE